MRKDTTQQWPGRLRIIGGEWRGRKLDVPRVPGLRPTSDRTRETLFNWLGERVRDAQCLDLFAGSGALGLEALSRGARHCDFVDTSRAAIEAIGRHVAMLGAASRADTHCGDGLQWRGRPAEVVFLDPPFSAELLGPVLMHLQAAELLTHDALVYVELQRNQPLPPLAPFLAIRRDKIAGEVRYLLLEAGG